MEKKICLFLCLFLLSLNLGAQKFMPSFKQDFLERLYENCPDSLKSDIFLIETPTSQHQFTHVNSMKVLEKCLREKSSETGLVMCYHAEEFLAEIRCTQNDFCFDFYHVNAKGQVEALRLLDNSGVYKKTFVTKSGKKYYLDYIWGFLNLKENNLPLLDCYCDAEKLQDGELEVTLIPFEGTNPFVWEKSSEDSFIPAF